MKTILTKFLILLGAPLMFLKPVKAQNSQPISEFNKLTISAPINVELVIADRYSIYLSNNNGQNFSNINIVNNELVIDNKFEGIGKIKVFTKSISDIKLSGTAKLESLDSLTGEAINISMDGSTKARLILLNQNTAVNLKGSSSLILDGTTKTASVKTTGVCKLDAFNLIIDTLTIETKQMSKAKVNVLESIVAVSEGTSLITYKGEPKSKIISITETAAINNYTNTDEFTAELSPTAKNTPEGDTTRVKIGKHKFIIIDEDKNVELEGEIEIKPRKMKHVYAGFELGVNALTTANMNFSHGAEYNFLDTKLGSSWFYGLNLLEFDGQLIKNKLALTTGFGMQFSNYHFDGDTFITPNSNSLTGTGAGVSLSTNKLYTYDLNMPLLLKYAPGSKKKAKDGFYVAIGAIVRYTTTAKVVTETTARGYDEKLSFKDDFNINAFRVDATVRIGYNKVKLFANYALTPYFKNSAAPDIRAFAVGITVVSF